MNPTDSRLVRIGQLELRFLRDETQGSGDLIVFEFVIPPQARVPEPHFHLDVDEFLYGLAGQVTSTVDGGVHEIGPGETLFIQRGRVHHHQNLGTETARVLCTLNPGSIGRRYFEELAEAINIPGRPDAEQVKEIMNRHGLITA